MKETGRSTQHCFPVIFLGFFFTVGKSLLQIDEGLREQLGSNWKSSVMRESRNA